MNNKCDAPKISIITVVLNAVNTIEQTILSVLNQSYENVEYIVVDGQSKDGTWEIIKKYINQIDVVIHEADEGLYDAMNKGIEKSSGDIIGFINADDWLEDNALTLVAQSYDEGVEVVYGNIRVWRDQKRSFVAEKVRIDDIWYRMIPHPAVFVKKEVYLKYGYFNLNYRIVADYELILRFYTKGVIFRNIDSILANFRQGGLTTKKALDVAHEVRDISLKYIHYCPEQEKYLAMIEQRFISTFFDHICCENEFKDHLMDLFDGLVENICIFGAGYWGVRLLHCLRTNGISDISIVDNNSEINGREIGGIVISTPDILKKGRWNVIIAMTNNYQSVIDQLNDYNNIDLSYVWLMELNNDLYYMYSSL